jgi:putative nucleotidyltransferase with HDIG domain
MASTSSIMVVDDEEDIRRLLATLLRRAGYQVAAAEGPLQALELLRQGSYALVITDLKMPDMDGLELLRRVAKRHPSTRGIVLTGYGSIQSAVEATKLGADNYITKPIAIDEFLRTVRSTLQRGRPLRGRPEPSPEVSSLAALTRLLAQPSLDLPEMVQGSVEIVASMLRGQARLRVLDAKTGTEMASAQTDDFPPLALLVPAAPVISSPHLQSEASGRLLTATLAPSRGYGGALQAARPPEAPPFAKDEAQLLLLAANQLSIALENLLAGHSLALTLRELRELSLQTVHALVRAVEMRDRYTAGHSARVSRYAVALAGSLGLDAAEVENVRVAALLHDVGKVGISDLLLNKPGPLTPTERAQIEEHPALGCQIVGAVQSLSAAVPLIMHHQEHYDGQGYPAQLAGDQIPHGARILAVADSFEAITATRAYRQGRSPAEALEILRAGSGQQWDPLLVARWQQIVDRVLSSADSS